MGFTDTDFEKAAQVNSNTQLYKQAGNSIVVQCLEDILRPILEPEHPRDKGKNLLKGVFK